MNKKNNCACELLLPPSKETIVRLAKIREEPLPKKYEDHIRAVSERFMRERFMRDKKGGERNE